MIRFDQNEIEILQAYKKAVDKRVTTFYDSETSQPSTAFKQQIREDYIFRDVDVAFHPIKNPEDFLDHISLKGNMHVLTGAVEQAGYYQAARYAHGSTAIIFIGVKDNDQWDAIRVWQDDTPEFQLYLPHESPVSVQPVKILSAGEDITNWTAPLMPIADFERDFYNGQLRDEDPAFDAAYDVMGKILNHIGIKHGVTQMGLTKEGVAMYVDPHEGSPDLEPDITQKKLAEFKQAMKEYPELHFIGDYINAKSGLWIQQESFPSL